MTDRLLPHVQAYENSGLARFGIGPGYRPDPYAPQNFAAPQLAPRKFFGSDLPADPGGPALPVAPDAPPTGIGGPGAGDTPGGGNNAGPTSSTGVSNSSIGLGLGLVAPALAPLGIAVNNAINSTVNSASPGVTSTNAAVANNPNMGLDALVSVINAQDQGLTQAQVNSITSGSTVGGAAVGGDAPGVSSSDGTGVSSGSATGPGDGGGGGGGGKIICTAMNDLYGLPYTENRIWTAYAAKNLTTAHQRGYHRVFLPLVRYAYKSGNGWGNRAVRAVLHWIAVERTKDLQDELAGRNPRPIKRALMRRPAEALLAWIGRK